MSRRVVVISEIIAPYRIPVFNVLARQPGIDLHVIFLADTDPNLRQWSVYESELACSYEVLPRWRARIGEYQLLLNWRLHRALRTAKPDVIVCGGYNYVASWQALGWAKRSRVRYLLWVESTSRDQRGGHALVESLKNKYLEQCDGFVVPGKSAREYLLEYGVAEQSIFVAPNAVDTDFFFEGADRARVADAVLRQTLRLPSRYLLYVGRLVAEKGVFDLLHAYNDLGGDFKERIGLVLAGDGKCKKALVESAGKISPGSVHFPGFVHREQLPAYYALAESFVLPTHSDVWGLVVNEAMACGLPVIVSSAAGCAADLVQDGWNGRVIDAGRITELAEAMKAVAADPEMRAIMGQRSRQRIRAYSPEVCACGIAEAALVEECAIYA